ncbi:hypothetical protein [Nonomuraea fuscirosea]|uniref:hypothetical protein n=1 Tax=Nonomuraea fuscirosea TaxID=1291556 RepID=UPI003434B5FF
MKITKYTHAWVRLEHEGRVLVVDPGTWSEPSALTGADAVQVPAEPVETLLVPLQASWLKTAEVIDFVRAVAPERAFGIHDGQINERGLASVNGWLGQETRHRYRWLAPLESG